MVSDIKLTSAMRSNLLSLQGTQKLMDTTQNRLATGLKVNSAIDNPSSYFTAQGLNQRAGDLEGLLDSMGQGIQTLKAADEGIKAITKLVEQAKAVVTQYSETASPSGKAAINTAATSGDIQYKITDAGGNNVSVGDTSYASSISDTMTAVGTALSGASAGSTSYNAGELTVVANAGYTIELTGTGDFAGLSLTAGISSAQRKLDAQYREIIKQIDDLARDSGYKGTNLLQGNDLTVYFNEDVRGTATKLEIDAVNIAATTAVSTAGGLGMTADIKTQTHQADDAMNGVIGAINALRGFASDFGNAYSVVQNREDFTKNLINVLTEGADKLTLADMNEEAANMLALQTRQQLGVNSLSLASQAQQSVLSLF